MQFLCSSSPWVWPGFGVWGMSRFWVAALFVPALVLIAGLMAVFFIVLSLLPPVVSWVSLAVFLVVVAWAVFARGRSGPVSETSLLGRQKTKEGLL